MDWVFACVHRRSQSILIFSILLGSKFIKWNCQLVLRMDLWLPSAFGKSGYGDLDIKEDPEIMINKIDGLATSSYSKKLLFKIKPYF